MANLILQDPSGVTWHLLNISPNAEGNINMSIQIPLTGNHEDTGEHITGTCSIEKFRNWVQQITEEIIEFVPVEKQL